jgi:Uma2 family endonuclease
VRLQKISCFRFIVHYEKGLFMATTPKVLTYEEWLKLPEVEGIEEVVNGEIQKMPPNRILHADIVENLVDLLKARSTATLLKCG